MVVIGKSTRLRHSNPLVNKHREAREVPQSESSETEDMEAAVCILEPQTRTLKASPNPSPLTPHPLTSSPPHPLTHSSP